MKDATRSLPRVPFIRKIRLLLLAAACAFVSCRFGDEVRYEDRASFPGLHDTLKQFERAVIIFHDGNGRLLDTVYNGPGDDPDRYQGLRVDQWDGGRATILIIGFQGGKEVYKIEKHYDGNGSTESTRLLLSPEAGLSAPTREFVLFEGDSLPLPGISVNPAHLADKSLAWSSSHPELVAVGTTYLAGLKPGAARITVRLKSDTSKTLAIQVIVAVNTRIPERIELLPETLRLAAGGAPVRALAKASPSSASAAVAWKTDDPGTATVGDDGTVRGVRPGSTWLRAASRERATVADSARLVVSDPVPVRSVRFRKDSTELFLGGSPESLLVGVQPPEAHPGVDFASFAPVIFALRDGWISAVGEGRALLVAASRENQTLTDTLIVRVSRSRAVDSLRITPRRLILYVGGENGSLSGQVFPSSAPEAIRWICSRPAAARIDADGRLTPLSPGNLRVYAVSAADSLVRDSVEVGVHVDAPKVSVGADTTLAVGQMLSVLPGVAPQAYGQVTAFRWDLDGDQVWDDSATALRTVSRRYDAEGLFIARFLVRDSEGNETVARKQVRVVSGRVVAILSPGNLSYSRQSRIPVRWSVDGVEQDSLTTEDLAIGPNFIRRAAPDGSGSPASATITVFLDFLPPADPIVTGPTLVTTSLPVWSWSSGGSGGSGVYRVSLDGADIADAAETRDTVFVPAHELAEGSHTLQVQERDAAGNWSADGRHTLHIDLTPPAQPTLSIDQGTITNSTKPIFRWQGGGGGIGQFRFRLDGDPYGMPGQERSFTPSGDLQAGEHVFQVRERDSAGHWSAPAEVTVTLDFTAPEAPVLAGATPTGVLPRWTWSSGGNGGSGNFRYKVDGNGNPAEGGTETRALQHALASATSGAAYTLHLQERDAAGNWSQVISHRIVYDLTRPSVVIRTPQAAGIYLTRLASVDVSGGSNKPEGGTAIQQVTYTLDGVTGTLPTNFASDGSWAIRALPLVNEKTLELKVTATDQSGNTGEAVLMLAMDSTPPPPPSFATQPPAVINSSDPRTTLEWTWTRGGAATDSFVVRLNGVEVARQTATNYSVGSLSDRTYALQIVEIDLTGNASAPVSAPAVTVDRTAPQPPGPTSPSPTRDNTPTWTWTSTGNGQFEYRLARDAAPTSAGTAHSAVIYTPSAALQDGAWQFQVRERDAAGNWSPWSSSSTVVLKAAPPAAPVLVRNASASNAPRWTWSGGGGGNGTFRHRWSGAGTYLGEGRSTEFSPANLAEQSHNLCVSERDTVGYGTEACASIAVDRTPPVLAGISLPEGFITNRSPILIRFTRDGTADSLSCDLADSASTVCRRVVSDAAGNSATLSRTVWYRSNVVFVKAGGAGARDGSSWADAYGEIGTALEAIGGRAGHMEVWVSEGDFPNFSLARSFTSIFGGFSPSGSPNSIEVRNPFTRVSRIRADSAGSVIRYSGEPQSICRNTVLDGFHIIEEVGQALGIFYSENAQIRNFWIERNQNEFGGAGLIAIAYSTCSFEKVTIRDNTSMGYAAVYLYSGGSMTMSNSEVSNNQNPSSWGTAGILSEYGGNVTLRATRLTLNTGGSRSGEFGPFYQAYNHGQNVMNIDQCVIQGLRSGVYPENNGSSIIWGNGNTEP